mmetsp:Transcript_10149/g.29159  ORF Transcript_10149/g.29159 Transcript_10149/m.29159 type:complete len:202 (+) Transcript_10149:823-1428(+)
MMYKDVELPLQDRALEDKRLHPSVHQNSPCPWWRHGGCTGGNAGHLAMLAGVPQLLRKLQASGRQPALLEEAAAGRPGGGRRGCPLLPRLPGPLSAQPRVCQQRQHSRNAKHSQLTAAGRAGNALPMTGNQKQGPSMLPPREARGHPHERGSPGAVKKAHTGSGREAVASQKRMVDSCGCRITCVWQQLRQQEAGQRRGTR